VLINDLDTAMNRGPSKALLQDAPRGAEAVRQLAVIGFGTVALAQIVFVVTGGDRGPTYVAVNALSLAAILSCAFVARRLPARRAVVGVGAALLAMGVLRILNVVLGTTRVALWISFGMAAGWILAGASALVWAADETTPRDALVRAGLYVVGFGYFASLAGAVSQGRVSAILGILLACIGLLVAAPNVRSSA
jgi:hypothetical protein